jgi:Tfp pilus assembly protein PilZ
MSTARSFSLGVEDPSLKVLPSVVAVFANRSAARARYLHDFPSGGLFVPGPCEPPPGARVAVHLAFVKEMLALQGGGTVRWKRLRGSHDLPAGVGIEFDPGARSLGPVLLDLTGDAIIELRRRTRRMAVEMPVMLIAGSVNVAGLLVNVSRSGALVRTGGELALGLDVVLTITPPGVAPMALRATTVRRDRHGVALHFIVDPMAPPFAFWTWCGALERLASEQWLHSTPHSEIVRPH